LREVREEAGIMARIIRVLDTVEYEDEEKKRVKVKFYLMEKVSESDTTEDRKPEWLVYPTAQQKLSHPQSKYFLALAERVRTNRLAVGVQSSGDPAGEG
jgi:ADP-ribose pyrophosphatase YjhB (NUDIX family)